MKNAKIPRKQVLKPAPKADENLKAPLQHQPSAAFLKALKAVATMGKGN